MNKGEAKGSQIIYEEVRMCEYLLPIDEKLSISDKRNIFSVKNRMVNISSNFPSQQKIEICVCGEIDRYIFSNSTKYKYKICTRTATRVT